MKLTNGKYLPWEFDNPNTNILHKESQQIGNCDMLLILG